MDNPLIHLIDIIKNGSRGEVKEAQKKIKKYWHNVYIPKRKEGKNAFKFFCDEIKKFDEIKNIDHQAYFISVLKWPFWSIGEEYFEEWAAFILKHIQHSSGKIRQAILGASDYLIMDIMIDLRAGSDKKISKANRERIKKNKDRFGHFVLDVERLLSKYHEPKFNRYKYIGRMPVSVYKSLQRLMAEKLLRSEYYENFYQFIGFLSNTS